MLFIIQLLILLVLLCTLIIVYIDERRDAARQASHAAVEEIWVGKERRKSVRVEANLDIVYSHSRDRKVKEIKQAQSEDISTGGAKIQLEEKLKERTPLSLEIRLPDIHKPINAKAEIVWVKNTPEILTSGKRIFGTGIRFTSLNPADKKALADFIKNALVPE